MCVNNQTLKLIFSIFVVLYLLLLLVDPQLGPSDEYAFLPTLQSGKFFPMYGEEFPYYNSVELGRFSPLAGQEYNLVALFANKPIAYFIFNAVALLLLIIILLNIFEEFSSNKIAHYCAVLIFLFMPAVTNTFFKLLYVEKSVILFLGIFLFSFIRFHKQQKTIYFMLALISANIAIYYKEIVFLSIFSFAAVHMLLTWQENNKKYRILDLLLICSSAIYISIYLIAILPNVSHPYLPSSLQNKFLNFVKNTFNYGFFSDPVIILIFMPIVVWRVVKIVLRRKFQQMPNKTNPIIDAMLAAGAVYAAAFFLLNMYSPYYMLPVYLFALPVIFYFFEQDMFRAIFWKSVLAATILILAINTIPVGLHYLTYNKYVSVNFNKTLDFLIADINTKYKDKRMDIFFDGVDQGNGRGVYFITGEFLKFKGLPIRKFDFKSNVKAEDVSPFIGKRSPFDSDADIQEIDPTHSYKYPDFPFTVFQPGQLQEIQSGDYLVVSPHSTRNVTASYIESLKDRYNLVFRTNSTFAFPSINLKTVVKYLLPKITDTKQKGAELIMNENLMNWPDYYVFVRK